MGLLDDLTSDELLVFQNLGLPFGFKQKTVQFQRKVKVQNTPPEEAKCSSTSEIIRYSPTTEQLPGTDPYNRNGLLSCSSHDIIDSPVDDETEKPKHIRYSSEKPSSRVLAKYWKQRYRLFQKFDQGIWLDEEGWYSATPECIAEHIAQRTCKNGTMTVVDAMCGAGGNTIQFAKHASHVIAIDINPYRLDLAKHNCRVYGVEDKTEFRAGDCRDIMLALEQEVQQVDVVFLAPPWGGPDYSKFDTFNLAQPSLGVDYFDLFQRAKRLTKRIVLCLPRNANIQQVVALAGPGRECEVERNFINKELKMITAYFSYD